jgi:hypothetical protein
MLPHGQVTLAKEVSGHDACDVVGRHSMPLSPDPGDLPAVLLTARVTTQSHHLCLPRRSTTNWVVGAPKHLRITYSIG